MQIVAMSWMQWMTLRRCQCGLGDCGMRALGPTGLGGLQVFEPGLTDEVHGEAEVGGVDLVELDYHD